MHAASRPYLRVGAALPVLPGEAGSGATRLRVAAVPGALPLALVLAALATACAGAESKADAPTVAEVRPACGDNTSTTPVTVRGTLPAKPEISLSSPGSSTLDTTYRAWVGDVELTGVKWDSATQLTAVVPAGLAAGTYGVRVQGPFGAEGSKDAAFQVREGRCPVETAVLAMVDPTAAPATLGVGQDITVTATVQNYGLAAARGVAAAIVSAPAGFTVKTVPGAPQDVPSGQARTFSWTYTATAPGGGVFVIGASGTAADTSLPVEAPSASTNAVLVSLGAFLTASTLVAPLRATVGQLVTVVLTVTNHAAAAAVATPAIAVSGPVTAGTTPSARSIPGGTSLVFLWTYTASAAGTATFTASVSGPDPGTGATVTVLTAPADVPVQGPPGLAATLAIPASIELGDFTVTMLVDNSGGAGAADVADLVPDPPSVDAGSTASAVLKSGPTVSPPTVTPPVAVAGQPAIAFAWVFTATVSGELSLSSIARGKDANSGAAVASPAASSGKAQVLLPKVGGTVSGLIGSGLVLHNGSDSLPVSANGPYTFPTRVESGGSYAVTVATQPSGPSQTCTVANASGAVGAANVTNVNVTCVTSSFTIGGAVSGFSGSGLVLHNGSDVLPIRANGAYTFPTRVLSGGTFAVTVASQPVLSSLTCTVSNGGGMVGAANVTNVNVTCATSTVAVGGRVSGLVGAGLVLHNGTDSLPISANGSYTFPSRVARGGTYAVTVANQPTAPSQTCTVASATGTAGTKDVTNVNVSCLVTSQPP